MSGPRDLARWARLWRALPDDERRARAGRVADRLLRRDRRIRALRLAPSVPSWRSFARALTVSLDELEARLLRPSPARGPLWVDLSGRPGVPVVPLTILPPPRTADGRFDWHVDTVSGVRWDPETYFTDVVTVRLDGSDVKAPWEWSRFQHLLPMGRARSREAAAQLLDWIDDNPPGLGVNWASPMEVALRAVSWCAALGYFRGLAGWEPPALRAVARALWVHGRHLRRNLEIPEGQPATNHYLANLLGLLAIARCLPELRESPAWGELARAGLVAEIERQVGADGVSFERSLPYHGFVTEMLLHAVLIEGCAGSPMPGPFRGRLTAMLEAIAWSLRPDGTIPAYGDGDDGRVLAFARAGTSSACDPRRLLALGGRVVGRPDLAALGLGDDLDARWLLGPAEETIAVAPFAPWRTARGRRFETSGWHVLRSETVHVGVAAGPVGTRGLGNHTHNDLFAPSFWAQGKEWIVDPGTGSYARDPEMRNRLRGVAAHATLQLGTREPNDLPPGRDGLFRVVERADPEVVAWEAGREHATLTARHTGYSGPEGRWTWTRRIELDAPTGTVSVDDRLEAAPGIDLAAAPREAWLRLPLAAGVTAGAQSVERSASDRSRLVVVATDGEGRRLRVELDLPEGAELSIEPSFVSPRYGVTIPSTVVVLRLPVAPVVEARFTLLAERGA